jgi:quercetin dioxygenase-like cupin family protein
MNTVDNIDQIFPKGEPAPPDYFTGRAWVKSLVPNDDTFHVLIGSVVFEAGCRNNWHTHPGGQILIVTEGTGYYQEKGKPVQVLNKGDVVRIAPGLEHWHGATPFAEFAHIAISTNTDKGVVNWLQRVTDEEYNSKQKR